MPCQKKVIFSFAITEPVIIYIWCIPYHVMGKTMVPGNIEDIIATKYLKINLIASYYE